MRIATLVLLCIIAMLPATVLAESEGDDAELIELLIEKAREREALFGGVDIRFNIKGEQMGSGGGTFDADGRWVRDGRRYHLDVEGRMNQGGTDQELSAALASDGETVRFFNWEGDSNRRGMIMPQDENFDMELSRDAPTPGNAGITSIPDVPCTLSELLEADNAALSQKYGRHWRYSDTKITAATDVASTVNDLDSVAIDCVLTRGEGEDAQANVHRLYFAPELNYACVKIEKGNYKDGEFVSQGSFIMDDFREAKNGLFVPYSMTMNEYGRTGTIIKFTAETFEFPESFDESLFMLEFPPGTKVRDMITGTSYEIGAGIDELDLEEIQSLDEPVEAAAVEIEKDAGETTAIEEPVVEEAVAAESADDGGKGPLLIIIIIIAVIFFITAIIFSRKKRGVS